MEKLTDFKYELQALLNKYNATIFCDLDGDTHGVSVSIQVEIDRKDYKLVNGSSIDQSDLKHQMKIVPRTMEESERQTFSAMQAGRDDD